MDENLKARIVLTALAVAKGVKEARNLAENSATGSGVSSDCSPLCS